MAYFAILVVLSKFIWVISTSNLMFERVIRDKLSECIFENFHIARLKRRQFQNFKNSKGDLSQKSSEPNMWLLVNHTEQETLCIFKQRVVIKQQVIILCD